MYQPTMKQMLEAGVHFGHRTRYWNPKMAPYIYGKRNQIHIINLEYSLPMYLEALAFVKQIAQNRGKVLFVGTKQAAQDAVRYEASRCGMPYVDYRWLGGMLTNYKTIRQSIRRLRDLEAMRETGKFAGLTKKEALNLMRQLSKLELSLGGIKEMGGLPDALFVIDVGHEANAVAEAKRLGIPVIGIVDTNNSPENINYMIPGNDDSVRSIQFYTHGIAETILAVKAEIQAQEGTKEAEKEEKVVKRKIISKKAAVTEAAAKQVRQDTTEADEDKAQAAKSSKAANSKSAPKKKTAAETNSEETEVKKPRTGHADAHEDASVLAAKSSHDDKSAE